MFAGVDAEVEAVEGEAAAAFDEDVFEFEEGWRIQDMRVASRNSACDGASNEGGVTPMMVKSLSFRRMVVPMTVGSALKRCRQEG